MNAQNQGNEYLRGVFAVRRLDLGREELETTHIGAIPRALLPQPFSLQGFLVFLESSTLPFFAHVCRHIQTLERDSRAQFHVPDGAAAAGCRKHSSQTSGHTCKCLSLHLIHQLLAEQFSLFAPFWRRNVPGEQNLLVLSIHFRLFLYRSFRHFEPVSKDIELRSG